MVVLEDDLIRYVKTSCAEKVQIECMIQWLTREFERIIVAYKDILPLKAKGDAIPCTLWIALPSHMSFGTSANRKRNIMSDVLEDAVKLRENMSCLCMLKFWSRDDRNSFLEESYRYTNEGLIRYWLSIDSAIRFCNVVIIPKFVAPKKNRITNTKPVKRQSNWKPTGFKKSRY